MLTAIFLGSIVRSWLGDWRWGIEVIEMFILVNIGCIECGVSSQIVGVFSTEEKAEQLAKKLYATHSWREGGQNEFQVFPMPEIDAVNAEYNE